MSTSADPRDAAALPDEIIREVIEAWERTGMMTEGDGGISPYVCARIRAEIKAVSDER